VQSEVADYGGRMVCLTVLIHLPRYISFPRQSVLDAGCDGCSCHSYAFFVPNCLHPPVVPPLVTLF
jgi:hypothetical protein